MNPDFEEYTARKIVNVHRHVDGAWFWDKYSAHPYVGCACGCEFCYARGGPYIGGRDPAAYDTHIRVKTNAPALLQRELARLSPDVISCGDWQQPAEERYGLSRAMLEVVLAAGFPLLVIERSPLLLRDLDLLTEIHRRAHVMVVLSFSSVDPALKAAFEPRSAAQNLRLGMMERLAAAGVPVGMALIPILPIVGDDEAHLGDAIHAAKDHGAGFVLAGGLTMAGAQATRTLLAAIRFDPTLEARWRKFYVWPVGREPQYGASPEYTRQLGLKVRVLCGQYGLPDRMPRFIGNGPLATNKRIAELLFLKTYDFELAKAPPARIWEYRKTAWAVDECSENIAGLFDAKGETGLQTLTGGSNQLASEIAAWIRAEEQGLVD